jgi:hypothetical protein
MPLIIRSTGAACWLSFVGLLGELVVLAVVVMRGCKTDLTASTSRTSPCVIVRKLAWVSGLIPLAVREAWSFWGERARAVQVYSLRRQAARQKPAQSPVAPKKAIVRVEDIFVLFLVSCCWCRVMLRLVCCFGVWRVSDVEGYVFSDSCDASALVQSQDSAEVNVFRCARC